MKPRSILIVSLVILTLFGCQGFALDIPTEGLVAYYSFDDGSAKDNSGNGNDGTMIGVTPTEGVGDTTAFHFDGSNRIDLPNVYPSDFTAITQMGFVKPVYFDRGQVLIKHGSPEIDISLQPDGVLSGGIHLADGASWGNWYTVHNNSVVMPNEWVHVALVIDFETNEEKLYINGNLDSSVIIPEYPPAYYGVSTSIGGYHWGGTQSWYFTGDIDEVMYYNRALTDTEILQIYTTAMNGLPTAQDDSYTVDQGGILTVPSVGVLANDVDPESDQLTALWVSSPINGDLQLNSDGSFTYTPLPDWFGNVTFTYKANDGIADSNEAQVWITVNKLVPPNQYIINATSVGGGSIYPTGDTIVLSGEDQSFDLQFKKPYQLAVITIDDITIDLKNLVVTFNNVFSDHTISAEFTSPSNKPTK